jgi:hypothetical protein
MPDDMLKAVADHEGLLADRAALSQQMDTLRP